METAIAPIAAAPEQGILLTYDEVALYESISRREVFNRVREGRYRIVPGLSLSGSGGTPRLAGNGRPVNRIPLSCLSPGAQAAFRQMTDEARAVGEARYGAAGVAHRLRCTGAAPQRSRCAAPVAPSPVAGIAAAESAEAGGRPLRAAEPALPARPEPLRGAAIPLTPEGRPDIVALRLAGRHSEIEVYDHRLRCVGACRAALEAAGYGDRMKVWARLEIELGQSQQTLRAWMSRAEKHGHIGLFPGWGHNRGETAMPEWMQRAIRARWLNQQRPRLSQVMATLRDLCRLHRCPLPSRSSVARWIERHVTPLQRAAFRHGQRAWEEHGMAKVHRDPKALAPNELWCADHRRMDTFVIAPDGRIVRPWLTLFIDLATASFAGWRLADRPSAQSVALALRMGILRRGVPTALYFDNGKEFTAERFGGKARTRLQLQEPTQADYEGCARWPAAFPPSVDSAGGWSTLRALGIEDIVNALPYSSWSKPIEPIFGAFARPFENLLPGWCGHSVEDKPEKLARELRERRLLTWEQYAEAFTEQVRKWESEHRCGDRALPPDAAYNAFGRAVTAHEAALDLLLLQPRRRKVATQGIEIGPARFMNDELMLYVGQWVDVLYDPDNLAAICVRPAMDPNRRLVVPALPPAHWREMTASNEAVWSARKAQRAHLMTTARELRAALSPEHHDPTGANALAAANAALCVRGTPRTPLQAGIETQTPRSDDSAAAAIRAVEKADADDTAARDEARRRNAAAAAQDILAQAAAVQAERQGA